MVKLLGIIGKIAIVISVLAVLASIVAVLNDGSDSAGAVFMFGVQGIIGGALLAGFAELIEHVAAIRELLVSISRRSSEVQ